MLVEPRLPEPASVIAGPSRARMLDALMSGSALPASQLAAAASVAPSTASFHLAKLVDAGLVVVERHGRHRLYRLAGEDVARAVETIALLGPQRSVRSLRESRDSRWLREARTCYDHLAGGLGVDITDWLLRHKLLVNEAHRYRIDKRGLRWCKDFGLKIDFRTRRPLARPCMDWSERRHHVAGVLGAAIADAFFAREWVERRNGGRALRINDVGIRHLKDEFGLKI